MKPFLFSTLILVLLSSAGVLAASKPQSPPPKESQPPAVAQKSATAQTDGDEVFTANCGRCHVPPMSISRRTTGTVIMHMRARARLSREDELLLLKYMAP
jgi:cytochrome c5